MVLYRAANLAEMIGVPDFFVDHVGCVQLIESNVITTMCRLVELGGEQLLVPKCDLIRPLALLPVVIQRLQDVLRMAEGTKASGQVAALRLH